MSTETGMLGVGQGVSPLPWVSDVKKIRKPDDPGAQADLLHQQAAARDAGIVQNVAQKLESQIIRHTQAINLPSVAAGSATTVDITCNVSERVFAGDWIHVLGYYGMTTPLVVMGGPAPSDDTFRLHLINPSAAARDAPEVTFYLEIHRAVTSDED